MSEGSSSDELLMSRIDSIDSDIRKARISLGSLKIRIATMLDIVRRLSFSASNGNGSSQ